MPFCAHRPRTSPCAVRSNDSITEANGTAVDSIRDFEEVIGAVPSGRLVRFYITRVDPRSGQTASFFAIVRVP